MSTKVMPHTWEQERAAIVEYLRRSGDLGKIGLSKHCYELCHAIKLGEHWPTEGKP